MQQSGLMIGHFEPLHLGHIRSIIYASGVVETLHIVITPHPAPNPKFPVTLQDKAQWLKKACRDLPFIKIHTCDDFLLMVHDNIEETDINIDAYNAKIDYVMRKYQLPKDTALFVTERHPLAKESFKSALNIKLMTTPWHKGFNSIDIHYQPITHWHIIHPEARGNYTQTLAVVGAKHTGKTTLVHKLANYYGANLALQTKRLDTDLASLQFDDYSAIGLDHAHAVRKAMDKAQSPITIIDTDFASIQAICESYENRPHPFIDACIDTLRFDHILFLEARHTDNENHNDNDGMLTNQDFATKLEDVYAQHNITIHHIDGSDYFDRYEQSIAYINKYIFAKDD